MDPTAIQPALLPALGVQCTACGAPLASDQRYCLECGESTGESRAVATRAAPEPAPAPRPPRRPRGASGTSGAALIAGVGTLVLALGVGVEIGRSSQHAKPAAAAPVRIVTVPGGTAAAPSATAVASATAAPAAGARKAGAAKSAKPTSKTPASPTATPPPAVSVGSKGQGRGYTDGKFTGDFFGG